MAYNLTFHALSYINYCRFIPINDNQVYYREKDMNKHLYTLKQFFITRDQFLNESLLATHSDDNRDGRRCLLLPQYP